MTYLLVYLAGIISYPLLLAIVALIYYEIDYQRTGRLP